MLISWLVSFSLFRLTESPSVWYDEGAYIQLAKNTVEYGITGLRLSPEGISHISKLTVGYPLIYPLTAVFKVFGDSVASARNLMVLFTIGLSVVSYALIRRSFGPGPALATLALLVTFPPLYGNGKSVLGEVPGLFFLVLFLLLLNIAFSKQGNRWIFFVFSGLFAGLAIATKPAFIVILPAVVVGMAIAFYCRKINLFEVICCGMSVVAPIILWIFLQFGSDISLPQLLSFYANPYGVPDIYAQVIANIKMLFTSGTPLYLMFMMFVWVLAMTIRKIKKINIPTEEIIAFVTATLVIVAFLRIVGWYRYIFPAQIIALIYFAPSLMKILEFFRNKISDMRGKWLGVIQIRMTTIIVIIFCLVGAYGLVFNSWVADYYDSHKTAFWEEYFKNVSPEEIYFFYDTPEVAIFDPHQNYYQYLEPAGGPFGAEWLEQIENGRVDKIVVETDGFQSRKDWFSKYYYPETQIYKYTILTKGSCPPWPPSFTIPAHSASWRIQDCSAE